MCKFVFLFFSEVLHSYFYSLVVIQSIIKLFLVIQYFFSTIQKKYISTPITLLLYLKYIAVMCTEPQVLVVKNPAANTQDT